ncbi:DUF998 domain-containing protein [Knoellia subterranea]|nr:DUF998 domain-containing protein [Knoellia subterranea]
MTTHNSAQTTAPHTCDDGWTPAHVTRSYLGWGVVAGPLYVVTSMVQGLTRDGFDFTRHQWSLLENGDLGWIQVTNFVLTGLALMAFAVGLHRALAGGRGRRAAWLAGTFGASMVGAAIFRADPALGFPVGTPEGVGVITTSGILHFACAGVGFTAIAVACFVVARRLADEGARVMAWFSRITGVAFLGGFACVASSGGNVIANLAFTAAVILVFTWIAVVAVNRYRALA